MSALKARSPDKLKRLNGAKQALEWPFEDEHARPGGEGTFGVNASEFASAGLPSINVGFVLHCSHNACARRDRLSLLEGMLAHEWLTESDLTDPAFLITGPEADSAAVLGNGSQKSSANGASI